MTPARRLAEAVAADGTDAEVLVRVVAWSLRPRRTGAGLRRVCRERAEPAPVERLRAAAPAPSGPEADAVVTVLRTWADLGVRAALVGDPGYPATMAAGWPDVDVPALLTWLGAPPCDGPSVGVVGARRASGYGTGVAAWLAATVARAGVRIVSGGARGVDAAAHEAALEEPGGTTVVLGCGHAVGYPRAHAAPGGLFDRVLEHGGTLASELLPHEPPHAANVRARNRVVAGLADALVVVEGGTRSGALITASAAADRGTPVLAVPGDVRAPGSAAPHRLLEEGAAVCRGPDDVLETLGGAPAADARGRSTDAPASLGLPEEVARALEGAWPRPVRVDDLAARTGRPVPALLATLTQARVAGVIAEGVDGVRLRRAP